MGMTKKWKWNMKNLTRNSFFLFLIFLANGCYAEKAVTFFSCTTENHKQIKLIGLQEKSTNQTSVKYIFQNNDDIELLYPEHSNNSLFSYNSYSRYRTNYFRVFFKNYSFEYMLYRNYNDELDEDKHEIRAGIYVTNTKTGDEYKIPCASIENDNLHDIKDFIEKDTVGRL